MPPHVVIVGRFPPPVDGQTLATQRLADLLQHRKPITVSTSAPEGATVQAEVRLRPHRVFHYLRLLPHLYQTMRQAPEATVLWASVSPHPLGHLRDLLTAVPAFGPHQRIFAVLHRGGFEHLFQSPLTAPATRWMVRHLSGFVFLNRLFADQCAPWIPDAQRFVIPNTVDDAVICTDAEVAAKQEERKTRQTLRLLFLSNMIPLKGYLDVLQAVRLLHARGVAVRAHFAGRWGSDADRAAFEQALRADSLYETVTYHGSITDRAQVKALHREADAFLLPSYHPTEAQPLAILEALNAGTPVIATPHGGIPEMVGKDEALFVPRQHPPAIADAVAQLLAYTRWRALSDGARRRFLMHFSPDAVRQQWQSLIETVNRQVSEHQVT